MIEIKKLFTVPFFLRSMRASDPLPSPPEMGRWWLLPRVGQAFDTQSGGVGARLRPLQSMATAFFVRGPAGKRSVSVA